MRSRDESARSSLIGKDTPAAGCTHEGQLLFGYSIISLSVLSYNHHRPIGARHASDPDITVITTVTVTVSVRQQHTLTFAMSSSLLSSYLLATSSTIIGLLGTIHLVYTFIGPKLHPTDRTLIERMKLVTLRLTKDTTVWNGWIGFNASHSLGAILFSAIYGHLSVYHPKILLSSSFLLWTGWVYLISMLLLGSRYWFKIPNRGIALATILYSLAMAMHYSSKNE